MSRLSTTKLSSKGQVVIPEEIRLELGLEPGERFLVVAENDVVVLKKLALPSAKEFRSLVKRARDQAKAVGLTESDIEAALKAHRGKS